ncbi:unnamed protein product, partial [marine sediment metagenome]
SFITMVLDALNDSMSINAACRTFHVSKNSIKRWLKRLADVKETLLLYALCHQFLQQFIEGDELYTKVHHNKPPQECEGWTIVLLDRATRFLWELRCDKRERGLFEAAMQTLSRVIEQTGNLALLTDGERRYGNLLFEICREVLHTGKPGRPKKTLPIGVKVRVKNKGSQAHKKGRKRPKYQAPWNEHPDTEQNLEDLEIHANHTEAFNSLVAFFQFFVVTCCLEAYSHSLDHCSMGMSSAQPQIPEVKSFTATGWQKTKKIPRRLSAGDRESIGREGFEPSRGCPQRILSPLRLPFRHRPTIGVDKKLIAMLPLPALFFPYLQRRRSDSNRR